MVGYQNYSQPLLQEEEHLYHDIVQGAFEDTYDNHIFKTLMESLWSKSPTYDFTATNKDPLDFCT
jgi:hypothetical protein